MKVLWVSHFVPYPPRGGNLQRSYHLLRSLAANHEVHLLAFNRRASIPTAEEQTAARDALSEFCASVEIFPIESEGRPLRLAALVMKNLAGASPVTTDLLESPRMEAAVARVASTGVDLLHLDTIDLAPYARFAPNVPIVLHHHNVESLLLGRRTQVEKNFAKKAYFALQTMRIARLEAAECPRHELNIAVSDVDARGLQTLAPGSRVVVVPNGVDLDYFRPNVDAEIEDRLVWAGGMSWYPNRDAIRYFMAEIWPSIRSERPNVVFDLIGRQPPPESDVPGVRSLGYLDEVRPIVGRAAVYVVPIRVGGGTRLKILDAMAMGKAIVSTSVGCEGIKVTPGTDILVADAPEAFAQATVRLLDDRELRRRIGASARRTVERCYGWDRVGKELESGYASLANGDHDPAA